MKIILLLFILVTTINANASFDNYDILLENNIFDAHRSKAAIIETIVIKPPPTAKIEYFTLTGIIITKNEKVAFIESSNINQPKIIKKGMKIFELEVKDIEINKIKLTKEDSEFILFIGNSMNEMGN